MTRPTTCSIDGCERPHSGRGLCSAHYSKARRAAGGRFERKGTADRFLEKVRKNEETGCWEWTACLSGSGYGEFHLGEGLVQAHHAALLLLRSTTIPKGMQVDHLCRVRHCVNPDHLEIVTPLENMRRSQAPSMLLHLANQCKRGHSLADESNVRVEMKAGRPMRRCKTCERRRELKRRVGAEIAADLEAEADR